MTWRARILAVPLVGAFLLAGVLLGSRAETVVHAPAAITLDGATLQPGTREVSPRPALALLLPPGSRPADFAAALDGRRVGVGAAEGRAARIDVGDLAQGSHHRLEVWRPGIGPERLADVAVDFQVAEPLELAASWLVTASQTTVQVSASRELAGIEPIEAALGAAGASVRHDDRGVEGRWPGAREVSFTLPAGLRATTGAYLPSDFRVASALPDQLPFSRVDLSRAYAPSTSGLKLRAYYVPGPAARSALARHARQVDILSPAFYSATPGGGLYRSVDEQALAIARAAGVDVEPLVTNQDFSADTAHALFDSPTASSQLAQSLVAEARGRGYRGYQLDFEGMSFGDRDAYTRFAQALAERLRAAGLRFSAAVIPQKSPTSGLEALFGHSGAYDYPALLRTSASMSVMAYDQHTGSTDPGPLAALDWVLQVAQASTEGLDRSRVFLGVPLYYRDWPLRGNPSAGGYDDALASAGAHDGTVSWDFASSSPLIRYSAPSEEHVVWFENRASLAAKLQGARAMGFGGIAAWRLGLEDPAWWDLWPSRP